MRRIFIVLMLVSLTINPLFTNVHAMELVENSKENLSFILLKEDENDQIYLYEDLEQIDNEEFATEIEDNTEAKLTEILDEEISEVEGYQYIEVEIETKE